MDPLAADHRGGAKQRGQEGAVLRSVFWHSIALAVLVGLVVLFRACVWPESVP